MSRIPPEQDATLTRFLDGPSQLEAAIAGLSDKELDAPPVPPGWTIRQIAHHIVDGDDLWKMYVKAANGTPESGATLQWYWNSPQDQWAQAWIYATRALEPGLALFRANRAHVSQLVTGIPDAWHRSVLILWPKREPSRETVGEIVQSQAHHALDHVRDIRAVRSALGRG